MVCFRFLSRSLLTAAPAKAGPFTFDQAARTELIQLLLKDLKSSKSRISSKGRSLVPRIIFFVRVSSIHSPDNALALLALKTLGKNPTGSETLGTAPNLSILLELVASLKDDPEASGEALRCIANALLLIERARSVFISKEVNGGETCMALLQVRYSSHSRLIRLLIFLLEIDQSGSNIHFVAYPLPLDGPPLRVHHLSRRGEAQWQHRRRCHRRKARPPHREPALWRKDGQRSYGGCAQVHIQHPHALSKVLGERLERYQSYWR